MPFTPPLTLGNIVFRDTTGDYTGKGSKLTIAEADNNQFVTAESVIALQNSMATIGGGIVNITQPSPTTMVIHLSDGTTYTVNLPSAQWNDRGVWQPSTAYAVNDVFFEGFAFYVVLRAHTSDTTFDPGKTDTGGNYYGKLFDFSSAASVLRQATTKTESGTTHTISAFDPGALWLCTNAAGCVVAIPDDGSYNAPIDTEVSFRQSGAGAVVIDHPTSVSYNSGVTGFEPSTFDEGSVITIKKTAANTWIGWGRFAEPTG
jgi:hypothetical protein